MKIDHIAMYVQDLETAKTFFTTYFEALSNDGYYNPKTGLRTYFLTFQDTTRLELMSRPDLPQGVEDTYHTGYIHLAFSIGSRERVDELTDRLRRDGYNIANGPRITGDGYYESCIVGPEGCQIELTV